MCVIFTNIFYTQVKEKIPKLWKIDVDFIKPGALFTITWENVFLAQPGSVKDFNVYISSFPGGKYLVVYSWLTGRKPMCILKYGINVIICIFTILKDTIRK